MAEKTYAVLSACIDNRPASDVPNERNKSTLTSSKEREELKANTLELAEND